MSGCQLGQGGEAQFAARWIDEDLAWQVLPLYGTDASITDMPPGMRLGTEDYDGKTYATYEIDVDASISDTITFGFFAGPDLSDWTEVSNPAVLVTDTGTIRTYRVRDDVAIEDAPARFFRIGIDPDEGGE